MANKSNTIKKEYAKVERRIKRKKKKFLEMLVEKRGNVLAACTKLAYGRTQMYEYRNEDEKFEKDWDDAVELGGELLADEAEMALRKGIVDKQNPALIIFTLKNKRPKRWKDVHQHKGEIKHTVPVPEKEARAYAKKILKLTKNSGQGNKKRGKRTKVNIQKPRKRSKTSRRRAARLAKTLPRNNNSKKNSKKK